MSDLRALYQKAFDAFASQKYDEAIELYRKVIDASPRFALAYQGLAETYARAHRLDEAIETIRKAIELEPEESLYQTSLSRFLQGQGNIPEAEEAAAQAAKLQSRRT